ncbi:MAG TPA: hypothetical protein VL281_08150 [Mycobacteriales bacterium]|jgi:hypothetical protein|nr:hypothetical protein [Mycobacteriales bacterium]
MSIEEPKSATEPAGAVDDQDVIELDDVEGHGMREVAAGLGAAAVLAGAGTAAAATVGVHATLPHLKNPTPSISDPVGSLDRTTDHGIATAREARDGALGAAGAMAANSITLANQEAGAATTTAGKVATGAEEMTAAFVDAAGNLTRSEVKAATQVAGSAEATALTTARTTVAGASTTATTTTTDATRKTATVVQLTTSTVNALETTITATVENLNPEAGAGTSGMGSTGWVTFSLGGETIASVQLSNGQATITVKTASLGGKVLQAVYSGSATQASSMLSMTL